MIRFIVKCERKNIDSPVITTLHSIDVDVPEIERVLRRGGYDQRSYEYWKLEGVELLELKGEGEE